LLDGGEKTYHDGIFVLEAAGGEDAAWREAGRLPRPLAHGGAVSTAKRLVCLGGRGREGLSSEVFVLRYDGAARSFEKAEVLAPLPVACDYLSVAVLDDRVYVAGGKDADGAGMKNFWVLDLRGGGEAVWESLPAWPGPARFGAALVVQSDGERKCLYLFGGKSGDAYLDDAYRYCPDAEESDKAWTELARMPRPVLAAPAAAWGQSHVMIFSGSDGHDVDRWRELAGRYQFPTDILAYHTITDTWIVAGHLPYGVACTSAVPWRGGVVAPSGEIRPGVRTPQVSMGRPKPFRSRFGLLDYAAIGGYLATLVLVGLYFTRREKTCEDFFLGGRRIPWWAAGLSLLATQVSSIGFMAVPAKSFATNWAYFLGVASWFLVVPLVNRAYIPFFRRLNLTSVYEYLELRFDVTVRLFGTVLYSFLQLGRMAITLYLPALALSAVTGVDTVVCILIMGLLCTAYTVAGGIEAVIWTDVLQAGLLIGGALVCVVIVVVDIAGGPSRFFEVASADGKFATAPMDWSYTTATVWVILVGNVFTRLGGLTADQAVVQRYLTTPDERTARRALWTDVVVSIPWAVIVFLLGTALYVFYKLNPGMLDATLDTDAVVPLFVAQMIPPGVAGLIIAALFAAAMSSLDSSMHSVATVWVTDVVTRFRPGMADRAALRWARWLTLLLGLFGTATALWMAAADIQSLWDQFWRLVGLFIGGLSGLFILGIFTRRASSFGAWAGALGSGLVLWWVIHCTRVHFFLYSAVGCVACVAIGYVASLARPHRGAVDGLTVFDGGVEG
jgi:SSS family transporter